MIDPRAIKDFFNRTLDRWDWLKDSPEEEVEAALIEQHPQFRKIRIASGLQLRMVQKVCILLCLYLKRFMLLLDMGAGKTLIVLMVLAIRKRTNPNAKAIVFVPYITAIDTWIEETEKHLPHLKCVPCLGTLKENKELLREADGDLFVLTYQTGLGILGRKGDTKKGKWSFTPAETRHQFGKFDMLVCDEIHKIRSVTSLPFYMLRAISKNCDYAFGLTGTPFGKNLLHLWTQFFLIDLGETLGDTLGFYKEAYFTEKKGYFGGYQYKFKQKLKGVLSRMIKHRSIRYRIDEIQEMPDRVDLDPVRVKPTDGIIGYYNRLVDEFATGARTGKRYKEMQNSFTKMRQLSSGFMTFHGEDTEKVQVELPDNPKLKALEEIIDGIPEDEKVVVFHSFRYTNKMICKMLKKMKIGHASIYGGQKDNIGELRRFKTDPNCRVMVINDQSGSSSLNLQVASYVIFFEQPVDPTDKQQGERRCWRPGQERTVIFINILMRGTIDAQMLTDNQDGEKLLKEVLDGRKKLSKL